MDVAASFAFSSSSVCSSPRSPAPCLSLFNQSQSAQASYNVSPRSSQAVSPLALCSPPLTPTSRVGSASGLSSPRIHYFSCPNFIGFDDSFGHSLKKFHRTFKGYFQRKGSNSVNVTANAGCSTEQERTSRKSPDFTGTRKTYYNVLGVPQSASQKEVRLAYRKLALQYHPDLAPLHQLDTATRLFSQINEAYATLSDPQKRACYDLKLAIQAPASSSIGYANAGRYTDMSTGRVYPSMNSFFREWWKSRNWETDQCCC
eukprot:c25036_g1_i1 orf=751-1527(-)